MKYAITCPGQGILKTNLLKPYLRYSIQPIMDTINTSLNSNFSEELIDNDKNWLSRTTNSQPAIVSITYIINHIAKTHYNVDLVNNATCILGHSLGEYSALCLANSISLDTSLRLVRLRAQLMEQMNYNGYAIKILLFRNNYQQIYDICANNNVIANINNYQQIVISGPIDELNKTIQQCQKVEKVRAKDLAVQIPFHSSKISSIESELSYFLKSESINKSTIPLISNLTARESTDIKDTIAVNSRPVNWLGSMEYLNRLGVDTIVNLGPSSVLYNLNKSFGYKNYIIDEPGDEFIPKEFFNEFNKVSNSS